MSKKRPRSFRAPSRAARPNPTAVVAEERRAGERWVWLGVLVSFATVIAYIPSLMGGFIWNDVDYVTTPALQSFGGLARIWSELGATEQYYPLLHTFFWLQHRVFGDHPAGYHAVNLLLHLGATVLFAVVLRRLLTGEAEPAASDVNSIARNPGTAAWLAAALFALHPVHVASVAWITEQKNTFSLVLYLAAFLVYLRFDQSRRTSHYVFALVLFGLSLLGKTSTATLPAAVLVVFWWQRGRLEWRRDVVPLLPWLALGVAAGIFSSWVERFHLGGAGMGAQGAEFELTLTGHVLLAGRAVWFYLGSLAWPFSLNFIYPRLEIDGTVWWQWLFPLALIAVIAALWSARRRTRAPLATSLLFVGTLFPVLGFVNLYGALYSRVWDHWQYLADLAPLAFAGAALAGAGAWAGPRFRRAGPALGAGLCILFGAMTWQRCGDFRDNETLYRTTLARNPDSWMAHGNLGEVLARRPETLPQAIEHYSAALRIKPDLPELHYNLANALAKTPGRAADAVRQYEAALRLAPDYSAAHNGLGMVLARMDGRLPEAISHYQAALLITPGIPEINNNLGIALLMSDRMQEAVTHFEIALRGDPKNALVHCNLGAAYQMLGRLAEAKAEYEAALRIRPDLVQARASLEQLNRGP